MSEAMQRLSAVVRSYARSSYPVLVQGETGTGKELVARALHTESGRTGRCVVVDCTQLLDESAHSELFGHARGAYTGAAGPRMGRVEDAADGTLVFDEVCKLSLGVQGRLLRLLENRTWSRLGENQEQTTTARFVFTTNRDLAAEVEAGRFRGDLLARLTLDLFLPPLRERPEDITAIVHALIAREPELHGLQLAPDALRWLATQEHPHNVRGLLSLLLKVAKSRRLPARASRADLVAVSRVQRPGAPRTATEWVPPEVHEMRDERNTILEALEATRHNQSDAARLLGMARTTLVGKMKRYGIAR